MDVISAEIEDSLREDISLLSLRGLNFALAIAALLAVVLLGFSIAKIAEFQYLLWGVALTIIVLARALAVNSLNKTRNRGYDRLELSRRIKRLAFYSGISDGIIWFSSYWIIFNTSLSNHYLIISLTLAAASTYGVIYLFQPIVALLASSLAIAPIVIFAYDRYGFEAYQLAVFIVVFGCAITYAVNEFKKLVVNYHRESHQHRIAARNEKEANYNFNQHWSNTPLAAIEWDRKFRIVRWNPSAEKIFGYSADEAIGQSINLIFDIGDVNNIKNKWRELWRAKTGKRSEETCRVKSGNHIHCEWHDAPITRNGSALGITSFVEDISVQVQSEQTIKEQAYFDTLTGLPNRQQMLEKIEKSIENCEKTGEFAALIFLDLDHFKDINDTKGHEVGDLVLKSFAKKLLPLIRHNDMVARFGGDEFVVLLEGLGKTKKEAVENTRMVSEKLLFAGANLCTIDNSSYTLDVSGGITLIDGQTESVNDLLKSADLAMYQVKQNGRRGISFYDESLSLEAEYRVEVLSSLRKGLDKNQFELFFQPIVDQSGNPAHFECLLRWRKSNNRLVSAGDFMEIVAGSPLIADLGYWIFNRVCEHLTHLNKKGLWVKETAFFVNVSPRQLGDVDFAARVKEIIESHKVDPRWIVIEITEESLISNFEGVISHLNELTSYGIRFALDDFGTGYSSLALLKDIPAQFLKLDKSFIKSLLDTCGNEKNAQIVEAIIKLCGVMSISVIAEGVETQMQYDTLNKIGCDLIQGYYFYKPLALASLVSKLKVIQRGDERNVVQFQAAK